MKKTMVIAGLLAALFFGVAQKNKTTRESDLKPSGNVSDSSTVTEFTAPTPLHPLNGSVFKHFPRHTVLVWEKSPDAASYTLEVDCFHCCQSGQWCTDVGRDWLLKPNLQTTFYDFNFVGAQPGRWRVRAINANGEESAKSEWQEFRFTK